MEVRTVQPQGQEWGAVGWEEAEYIPQAQGQLREDTPHHHQAKGPVVSSWASALSWVALGPGLPAPCGSGTCAARSPGPRRGLLAEKMKTKAQWQVSVQEVGLYILVTGGRNEASGQQCRGHRENKRSRAGVWRQSYKVYKESVFLYNNKKTKGYKSGCIYKTRRYCFTCKQVPDQTGDKTEGSTGREGRRARCVQKDGEGGEGSSPSINLQAGAGVAHTRERSKACTGAGCAWGNGGAESQECPPALAPWRLALRADAQNGVLGGDRGPVVGPTGRRGREVIAPWSLPWKIGEACSVCPSSLPLAGPVRPATLPDPPRCTLGPKKSRCSNPGF